jgi:hypothetical protein
MSGIFERNRGCQICLPELKFPGVLLVIYLGYIFWFRIAFETPCTVCPVDIVHSVYVHAVRRTYTPTPAETHSHRVVAFTPVFQVAMGQAASRGVKVQGTVAPGYEPVKEIFQENFE